MDKKWFIADSRFGAQNGMAESEWLSLANIDTGHALGDDVAD